MSGWVFLSCTRTKQGLMWDAQIHKAVRRARLKPQNTHCGRGFIMKKNIRWSKKQCISKVLLPLFNEKSCINLVILRVPENRANMIVIHLSYNDFFMRESIFKPNIQV